MGLSRTVSEINGDFVENRKIFRPRVFYAPADDVAIAKTALCKASRG